MTRTCWRSTRMTPRCAASRMATGCGWPAGRARRRCGRRSPTGSVPGVVYTTFHHPDTQANVITTDYSRLGHQLPGIQGDGGAGRARRTARPNGRRTMPRRPRSRAASCRRRSDGDARAPFPGWPSARAAARQGRATLPEEVAVALSFNGTTQAVMMATPADLVDFAYGFALTEGHRRAGRDRQSVEVVETAARA